MHQMRMVLTKGIGFRIWQTVGIILKIRLLLPITKIPCLPDSRAKACNLFRDNGLRCVLAAEARLKVSDVFLRIYPIKTCVVGFSWGQKMGQFGEIRVADSASQKQKSEAQLELRLA